jgi:hypothetical protein
MKHVANASEAAALYGDLTGVAFDPVVRYLMYESIRNRRAGSLRELSALLYLQSLIEAFTQNLRFLIKSERIPTSILYGRHEGSTVYLLNPMLVKIF